MSERQLGGCLCGAIRYEISGPLRSVLNCHCGMCRRFHGHFGAYTSVSRANLTFRGSSEPGWYQSSDSARRGFCPSCGASLFWQRKDSDEISIAAGSLDQPTGLNTAGHIFTADKGDYYDIDGEAPQWPGSRFY